MISFTDWQKNWSFPPFFCRNINTLRNEEWWTNFTGKTSLHVQAFKSLFYIDAFLGTEGRYGLLFIHAACLILWPYVATLFATRVLEPLCYSSPFLSLSSGPLATASDCHCVLCLAQWSGLLLSRGCNGGTGGGSHCCQIPAVPPAGGPGCGGSPFLPAWLLRQCPLGNWQPGVSCGLWSSSRVASWPVLCQSSEWLGANNGGIHSLELQL